MAEKEAFANLAAIARLKTDQIENWLGSARRTPNCWPPMRALRTGGSRADLIEHPATGHEAQQAVLERFSPCVRHLTTTRIELISPRRRGDDLHC